MTCKGCSPIVSVRPSEEELSKYPKPCDCGVHVWVYVPAHKQEVCRKCKVLKRPLKDGKNPPCPGKSPWTDIPKN